MSKYKYNEMTYKIGHSNQIWERVFATGSKPASYLSLRETNGTSGLSW